MQSSTTASICIYVSSVVQHHTIQGSTGPILAMISSDEPPHHSAGKEKKTTRARLYIYLEWRITHAYIFTFVSPLAAAAALLAASALALSSFLLSFSSFSRSIFCLLKRIPNSIDSVSSRTKRETTTHNQSVSQRSPVCRRSRRRAPPR